MLNCGEFIHAHGGWKAAGLVSCRRVIWRWEARGFCGQSAASMDEVKDSH